MARPGMPAEIRRPACAQRPRTGEPQHRQGLDRLSARARTDSGPERLLKWISVSAVARVVVPLASDEIEPGFARQEWQVAWVLAALPASTPRDNAARQAAQANVKALERYGQARYLAGPGRMLVQVL